jgi:hypothetical protein
MGIVFSSIKTSDPDQDLVNQSLFENWVIADEVDPTLHATLDELKFGLRQQITRQPTIKGADRSVTFHR